MSNQFTPEARFKKYVITTLLNSAHVDVSLDAASLLADRILSGLETIKQEHVHTVRPPGTCCTVCRAETRSEEQIAAADAALVSQSTEGPTETR